MNSGHYSGLDRDALRYAMRRAGFTGRGGRAALAAASGLRVGTLDYVLGGSSKSPSCPTLCSLADALGMDPRDLLEPAEYQRRA